MEPELFLKKMEFENLSRAAKDDRDRCILLLLGGAGLRASELVTIRIEEIDLKEGYLHIPHGKGNKRRAVVLVPHVIDAIDRYLAVATMQTAATDAFLSLVCGGAHLMMVADEVHQLGSVFNSRAMSIESGSRLGLSATPTRYGDPAGTQQLVDYFGAVLQPPFTLNDAIAAGRLVEYEYYPKPVTLTAEEAQEWSDQTSRIRLEIARQGEDASGRKPLTERAKLLLIQRSRIAEKAFNRVALARQVLGQAYEQLDLSHSCRTTGASAVRLAPTSTAGRATRAPRHARQKRPAG